MLKSTFEFQDREEDIVFTQSVKRFRAEAGHVEGKRLVRNRRLEIWG